MGGAVKDNWEHGDAYELFIGRWSSLVAVEFLNWLELPGGLRWVDVGCGTGALSETILDTQDPTSVVGLEPSAGFVRAARERLGDRAEVREAPAENLPLPDGAADVVVSGLVLNFIDDLPAALAEMKRVAPGGEVAAYVWDYSGGMQMLGLFWDAADEVDPGGSPGRGPTVSALQTGGADRRLRGRGAERPRGRRAGHPHTVRRLRSTVDSVHGWPGGRAQLPGDAGYREAGSPKRESASTGPDEPGRLDLADRSGVGYSGNGVGASSIPD